MSCNTALGFAEKDWRAYGGFEVPEWHSLDIWQKELFIQAIKCPDCREVYGARNPHLPWKDGVYEISAVCDDCGSPQLAVVDEDDDSKLCHRCWKKGQNIPERYTVTFEYIGDVFIGIRGKSFTLNSRYGGKDTYHEFYAEDDTAMQGDVYVIKETHKLQALRRILRGRLVRIEYTKTIPTKYDRVMKDYLIQSKEIDANAA
jgi:hypothetical protein